MLSSFLEAPALLCVPGDTFSRLPKVLLSSCVPGVSFSTSSSFFSHTLLYFPASWALDSTALESSLRSGLYLALQILRGKVYLS